MKFKKQIIAIILIICMLFTIHAISAADNSTDVISVTNSTVKAVNVDVANNNLAMENDVESLGETDGGNFTDLNTAINGDSTLSIIYLDKDYLFDSSTDSSYTSGIRITRSLTIEGNGHIIDANGKACIIESLSSITLKNITFKNAYSTSSGGAVYLDTDDNSIINCTFINNQAKTGAAIYSHAYSRMGSIINSTFINNKATEGEIIYNYADDGTLDGCIFVNNTATTSIIYTYSAIDVQNSIFVNNEAENIFSAYDPSITANNNWWGNTVEDYQNLPTNLGSGVTANKYYVLDMVLDDQGTVTVNLNNLYENGVITVDSDYALPSIKFEVVGKGVEVPDSVTLSNGVGTIEFTPADVYAITVSYNGVELTREIIPTFTLLNDKVNAEGSEISLDQDYIYDSTKDSGLTNGIEFAKDMTIDGQGHSIDAKQSSNIFYFNDNTDSYTGYYVSPFQYNYEQKTVSLF